MFCRGVPPPLLGGGERGDQAMAAKLEFVALIGIGVVTLVQAVASFLVG